MRPFPRSPNESLRAALLLSLLLAIFLAAPLARCGDAIFSPADILQGFPLTTVDPGHAPKNPLLAGAALQMQPWTMFDRDELAAGRVPLWNPWNGAGLPHLANYRSAAFSPFTLPFYALGFKAALIASAFLKLFSLGFFTFLFLRELRLSSTPALLGAIAFMFAGHNVLWLSYPHVGALVALPAGLLFAEKALRRFESVVTREPGADAQAQLRGPLAGLTLSLTAGWLAGHPEPLFFAFALLSAWVAARLFGIGIAVRRAGGKLRTLGTFSAKLALAGLLAAGFAAVQILPFLEYLRRGPDLAERALAHPALDPRLWPLAMFPDALQSSVDAPALGSFQLAYVGGSVLFLALIGSVFLRRDLRIAFFLLGALTWDVYAYDLLGTARIVEWIPGLGLMSADRSQAVWSFCAACAAALSLDHLLRREEAPAWGRAILTALCGLAFLAAFRFGVQRLIEESGELSRPGYPVETAVAPHLRWIAEVFAAGTVAICLLWVARGKALRAFASSAVLLVVFLQTGWHFKDYNPICEDRLFFPVTPSIEKIRQTVGRERVAIQGGVGIPPDSNLAYGIALLQSRDAMHVRDFDALYRKSFGTTDGGGSIVQSSERALNTFGVPWVLALRSEKIGDRDAFQLVERIGDYDLYRTKHDLGRFWTVRAFAFAEDEPHAMKLVRAPSFDPARVVVLGPESSDSTLARSRLAGSPEAEAVLTPDQDLERRVGSRLAELPAANDMRPRVLEETPTWIRLEVDASAPEHLVIAQTHYPGWKARVNGIEKPVLRANYAFSAIEMQPGLNVVDFSYEPESFRLGLWIGLASALSGLLCLFHRSEE